MRVVPLDQHSLRVFNLDPEPEIVSRLVVHDVDIPGHPDVHRAAMDARDHVALDQAILAVLWKDPVEPWTFDAVVQNCEVIGALDHNAIAQIALNHKVLDSHAVARNQDAVIASVFTVQNRPSVALDDSGKPNSILVDENGFLVQTGHHSHRIARLGTVDCRLNGLRHRNGNHSRSGNVADPPADSKNKPSIHHALPLGRTPRRRRTIANAS